MRYTIKIIFKTVVNGVYKKVPDLIETEKTFVKASATALNLIDDSVLQAFIIDNVNQHCTVIKSKVLFRAQYLGQSVHCHIEAPNLCTTLTTDYLFDNSKEWFLLLRTTSQLTDEDAKCLFISVFKDAFGSKINIDRHSKNNIIISTGKDYYGLVINLTENRFYTIYKGGADLQAGYDTLKLLGYVLPFTFIDHSGNPITLSVEEILKLNWCRIKD